VHQFFAHLHGTSSISLRTKSAGKKELYSQNVWKKRKWKNSSMMFCFDVLLWYIWKNNCVHSKTNYHIVVWRTLQQLSDIPGDFMAALNELLAQVFVAMPWIIGDNDRDCRQYKAEPRPPRWSRHRPSDFASPVVFEMQSGLFKRLWWVRTVSFSSSLFWNPNIAEEIHASVRSECAVNMRHS